MRFSTVLLAARTSGGNFRPCSLTPHFQHFPPCFRSKIVDISILIVTRRSETLDSTRTSAHALRPALVLVVPSCAPVVQTLVDERVNVRRTGSLRSVLVEPGAQSGDDRRWSPS